MKEIIWEVKHFDDLTMLEFHDMIQLREKVFVVEQDCPYLDVDGEDVRTYHVLGKVDGAVVATARIFAPNESNYVIIGRICNDAIMRGKGTGRELVKQSIAFCQSSWKNAPIKISAQCYLTKFYESFGFEVQGEEYLEDDIPHIGMVIQVS